MHISSALLLLSAAVPLSRAFEFTSPDFSQPINLSEPVVLEWTFTEDSEHRRMPWLQLGFVSDDIGAWWLNDQDRRIYVRNVSSFTWDAPAWVDSMTEQVLREGRHNYFDARLYDHQHSNQSGGFVTIEPERFEVVGYPYLESGAGAAMPSLILGLLAGALAIIASL